MTWLIGGICYFDDNGNKEAILPLGDVLYLSDERNGLPDDDDLVLSGDKLIFVSGHRRHNGPIKIEGWLLNEDRLAEKFMIRLGVWLDPIYFESPLALTDHRWLGVTTGKPVIKPAALEVVNCTRTYIDLDSIRKRSDDNKKERENPCYDDQDPDVVYDKVTIPGLERIHVPQSETDDILRSILAP